MFLLGLIGFYVWLSWAFSLFPWTRVWGTSLGDWTLRVVQQIALGDCLGLAGADDCSDHFPHYRFYSEAS